ncbi:hypothetical protein GOV14_05975 [Candidatus Pacearchaeota archaeon]|nr:hypothetical protein [Candidatus Pacearchaeota archaeon]
MHKQSTSKGPALINIDIDIIGESGFGCGMGYTQSHIPYGEIDGKFTYDFAGLPELKELELEGYKLNERKFKDIKPLFSEDYNKFEFLYSKDTGVYLGAEHSPANVLDKKGNLTFFGNLEARLDNKPAIIMASSMGHFHPLDLEVQEEYQFNNFGAMTIQKENKETYMIFMKPGGKVTVPGKCHMTIYNMDLAPLDVIDFANPAQNTSNKDLQKQIGPVLCAYYLPDKTEFVFKFNPKHINSDNDSPIRIYTPKSNLGETLYFYAKNQEFRRKFAKRGIKVSTCEDHPKILGIPKDEPLSDIIKEKSPEFRRIFNL